jgi:hypothetical protein
VDATGVQDVDGNAGVGVASVTWTLDATRPQILFLEDPDPEVRNLPVLRLDVRFSEPIDPATLDAGDIILRLDGGPDRFAGNLTVTSLADNTYRISGFG